MLLIRRRGGYGALIGALIVLDRHSGEQFGEAVTAHLRRVRDGCVPHEFPAGAKGFIAHDYLPMNAVIAIVKMVRMMSSQLEVSLRDFTMTDLCITLSSSHLCLAEAVGQSSDHACPWW